MPLPVVLQGLKYSDLDKDYKPDYQISVCEL